MTNFSPSLRTRAAAELEARRRGLRRVDYWPLLHIQDKDERLVPLALNAAQRHFLAQRTGRDLILKARQMGMSTAVQAHYFVTAITERARLATLAHDDTSTALLRRMAARFWEHLPDKERPPRGLDNATTTSYPATGSEVTIVTAGNKHKGRAGTYSRVHGSEVAFWPDAEATMAGLMQGVPASGEIILESTPNGARGWFYDRCMEALDGRGVWTLHFFPWWWDAGYTADAGPDFAPTDDERALVERHGLTAGQLAWRRLKIAEIGARLFQQEYPEDARTCFLLSGDGYFGDLAGCFTAPDGATPQAGHWYVAGLDFGQANDWTVLSIVDGATLEQVELLRLNKLPWADMRARIADATRRWAARAVWAESNSIGQPNIEALAAAGVPVVPFQTTAATKGPLIAGLHHALHDGGLKLLDRPEQRRELAAFQARQTAAGHWTYSAPDGEHDDTVIANALAWHGAAQGGWLILFGD